MAACCHVAAQLEQRKTFHMGYTENIRKKEQNLGSITQSQSHDRLAMAMTRRTSKALKANDQRQ